MNETQKKEALLYFATGSTDAEVAARFDVDRSTAWRWRKDLAEEITNFHAETLEVVRSKFVALASEAVATLAEIMGNPESPENSRLRAAEAILERVQAMIPEKSETTFDADGSRERILERLSRLAEQRGEVDAGA